MSVIGDLSDTASTLEAVAAVLEAGPVLRLVNNVGLVCPSPVESQSPTDLDQVLAVNVRAALLCLQAVLPGMKAAGFGRVVNISSRAALGKAERSAYAAAKAGIIGMTRVWALELGRVGITANCLAPGPIATDLFTAVNPPGDPRTRALVDAIPLARVGTPDDVANACAFFLDERSGFVTGQTLYLCGGLTVGANPL